LADRAAGVTDLRISMKDFDLDGRSEVLVETPSQNLYLSPHEGGSLFEWDLREQGLNLQNVLTRRSEGYHKQLIEFQRHGGHTHPSGGIKTIHDLVRVKEPGLDKRLFIDWYRRTSLLDHFLHPDTTLEDF